MNQQERRYASRRIEEIRQEKEKQIRESCKLTPSFLKVKEFLSKLKKGEIKTRKNYHPTDVVQRVYISRVFDIDEHQQLATIDSERFQKEVTALNKKASSLRDHIMLGEDCAEVLKMIEEFANE